MQLFASGTSPQSVVLTLFHNILMQFHVSVGVERISFILEVATKLSKFGTPKLASFVAH